MLPRDGLPDEREILSILLYFWFQVAAGSLVADFWGYGAREKRLLPMGQQFAVDHFQL